MIRNNPVVTGAVSLCYNNAKLFTSNKIQQRPGCSFYRSCHPKHPPRRAARWNQHEVLELEAAAGNRLKAEMHLGPGLGLHTKMIIAPHFLPRFQPTPSVDLRWNDYTTQQPGWGQYKWVERDLFINVFTHIYVKSYATCLNRNLGMFCAGGLEQCKFMKHMVWYSRSRSQPRSLQIFFAIKQIQHWGKLTLRALFIFIERQCWDFYWPQTTQFTG